MFIKKFKGMSDNEITDEIDRLTGYLSKNYSTNDVAIVIGSLATFLSYRIQNKLAYLQQEVSHDTKDLIKWNRRLAIFTGVLAFATAVLALAASWPIISPNLRGLF